MRKFNYILSADNTIISYTEIPFDETAPYIELENSVSINVGVDKIADGKLVSGAEIIIKQNQILELKEKLAKTDYLCLKFADGALSEEEYAPIRTLRQNYRDQINELEAAITTL